MASALATPLSSTDSATLNAAVMSTSTPTIRRLFDVRADELPTNNATIQAAPQGGEQETLAHDQENVSPEKNRHSRILSGNGLSPFKIMASHDQLKGEARGLERSPSLKNPRKRFPIKVASVASPEEPAIQQPEEPVEEVIVEEKEPAKPIDIFEDEDIAMTNMEDEGEDTLMSISRVQIPAEAEEEEDYIGPDDTLISAYSSFSAVPNLTMFASIGHTPTKFANVNSAPTPRGHPDPFSQKSQHAGDRRDSDNTMNLLDFTDQMQTFSSRYSEQMSNLRRGSPGKVSANPVAMTPKKRQSNLLDFDIPPLPTPRSIPTITPRELESLKSGFLSEISSLKASLSGKEAEVLSLKTAVADAEKRVGESLEELRELRAVKEALFEQQDEWEQRGRDMESVLRKVKEEIVRSQRECDQLESKFEESEKRREAAEMMAQEAESKMAAMRAGKTSTDTAATANVKSPERNKLPGSREVEIAVEKVSRELHSLYKSKHESKITALKKSYENRWSKKVQELETRIDDLAEDNERLRIGRDATMTRVDPNQSVMIVDEERKAQAVRDSTQIRELNAEVQQLGAVLHSVKTDNQELRVLLERERIEKGELVQLAEEMMSMQSFGQPEANPPPPPTPAVARPKPRPMSTPAPAHAMTTTTTIPTENFRASIGRASGLRAPGSIKKPTESRIGGIAGSERKIGGIPRPGSGMGSRSGIMSSIEKMGSYRGRGE